MLGHLWVLEQNRQGPWWLWPQGHPGPGVPELGSASRLGPPGSALHLCFATLLLRCLERARRGAWGGTGKQ